MARARPTSPRCPRCNAPFALTQGQELYTCGYCNASIDTRGEKAPLPSYEAPPVPESEERGGIPVGVIQLAAIGGVVLALIALVVGFITWTTASESTGGPIPGGPAPIVVARPPGVEKASTFQWDTTSVPLVVDLNGDGTDDFVGRIRRLMPNTGGTDIRSMAAAFDGKSLGLLWETGLEGSISELSGTVHLVHQGGRVVMSSPDAVSILDPQTGKQLGRVALSDKPRNLCIPQGDTESVWVDVSDGQNLLLNTKTAAARPAIEPPPSCAPFKWNPRMCPSQLVRRSPILCERPRNLPDVPGFSPEHVYKLNDLNVVLGERSPGSRVPMAAVFQQGQKAPLWHGNVADMDPKKVKERVVEVLALSEDALIMAYELKEGGAQLIRRDMRTGSVSWDVPIPNSKSGSGASDIKLHGGRVYVPHWVWLDVFDAKTGNLIGTLGKW
ncbi:hypothetical protein BHS06_00545 [Myxococcus xanthus]|uniref:hypothetical protein n=1 Tax=Myxococcus xanthus TaxID=34 RepID=UPI001126409D|nr:hypothetical protein [Myxococcus xanthus]QDE87551.1 hypothetical protein BHS06_00545 [Myxococcus xanthus]